MVKIKSISKMVKKVNIKVIFIFICLGLLIYFYFYKYEMKTERFQQQLTRAPSSWKPGGLINNNTKCPDPGIPTQPTKPPAPCVSWKYKCDPADIKLEPITTFCKDLRQKTETRIIKVYSIIDSNNIDIDTETDKAIHTVYKFFNDEKNKNKPIHYIIQYPEGTFYFNYR